MNVKNTELFSEMYLKFPQSHTHAHQLQNSPQFLKLFLVLKLIQRAGNDNMDLTMSGTTNLILQLTRHNLR